MVVSPLSPAGQRAYSNIRLTIRLALDCVRDSTLRMNIIEPWHLFDAIDRRDKENVMKASLIAIGLICAAAASLVPQRASAQAPQQERYGVCRHEAAVKGIEGNAYGAFLDECMMRPASASAAPSSQERFASCQSQARAKGRGEAYGKALDQCMSASSASGAPSSSGMTYADCRPQAVAQGMKGDRLADFIDKCVGK
jgi:hypothetical protein